MKTFVSRRVLNIGTRGAWVVSFTLRPLYLGTHWTGGWMGGEKRKISLLLPRIEPRSSNP